MKKLIQLSILCLIITLSACKKNDTSNINPASPTAGANLSQRSQNGSAGIELVYYDSTLFKMNLKQFSDQTAASLLAHNTSINILYEATGFKTVTDAIQGDGYNPIWREVDIKFNTGFTPHQFYRDDAVLSAASGAHPEITLIYTNEVYRCDIIQQNK